MVSVSANAEVTVQQSTDPEYLINAGFSEALAEDVLISKNRANGMPCEPLYDKNEKKLVRYWKKFYSYLDPAIDNEERYHHDIKLSPHYTDL